MIDTVVCLPSPHVYIPLNPPTLLNPSLTSYFLFFSPPLSSALISQEQAKLVVAGAKFPTNSKFPNSFNGFRGAGSPIAPMVSFLRSAIMRRDGLLTRLTFPVQIYGQSLPDYIETSNERTVIMLQIETLLGVQNVNEIAAVEGVGEWPSFHPSWSLV